jgi:hypothetical protein
MEILYNTAVEISKVLEKILNGQPEPSSHKEGVLLFVVGKTSKTLDAIVLLCKAGYGEDATILSRSIFELYWFLEYVLSNDNGYLAERFFDYDWVVRQEMYENVKNNPMLLFLKSNQGEIEEVEQKAQEMQKKHKFSKQFGWSDKSISNISNLLGHSSIYQTAYKIQCSFCHPNPRATNDYFKEGDSGEFILDSGPSSNLVKESLISSLLVYIAILKDFNNTLERGFNDDLNILEARIISIINE